MIETHALFEKVASVEYLSGYVNPNWDFVDEDAEIPYKPIDPRALFGPLSKDRQSKIDEFLAGLPRK